MSWLRQFWVDLIALMKRFLANKPANKYEQITFDAIRDIGTTYAKGLA